MTKAEIGASIGTIIGALLASHVVRDGLIPPVEFRSSPDVSFQILAVFLSVSMPLVVSLGLLGALTGETLDKSPESQG